MAQGRCRAMLTLVLVLVSAAAVVHGATYQVGGVNGTWAVPDINTVPNGTTERLTYYSDWAASQNFSAGDTVVFTYNMTAHNVVTLSSAADFDSCNLTASTKTTKTGNDSLILAAGANFFVCGTPGHCSEGQKLQIKPGSTPGSSPRSPSTSPRTPTTSPRTPTTSPRSPGSPDTPDTPVAGGAASGNTVTVVQVMAAVMLSLVASPALW